jgi:cyclopropane fatty-acyl-phospholipid synthase-like methyltransferase
LRSRLEAVAKDPRKIVEQGYDAIGRRYSDRAATDEADLRILYVGKLFDRLPAGCRVLELGCGAGVPVAKALVNRYEVVGVDISSEQLVLAKLNVPTARFVRTDMRSIDFHGGAFDAVIALYSLTHVPREEHGDLLSRIHDWITQRGYALVNIGAGDDPGTVEDDWLGAPMFFSSYDADTNRQLIEGAGFEIIEASVIPQQERGRRVAFLWVLAQAR